MGRWTQIIRVGWSGLSRLGCGVLRRGRWAHYLGAIRTFSSRLRQAETGAMVENAGIQATRVGRAGQPPRSELTELGDKECWELLRAHDLGRLAIVVDEAPLIFPINYAAHAGAIVFQTSPGLKLTRGPGSRAAFEIDGYDRRSATGWSVLASGVLQDISEATDHVAVELRAAAVWPMAPGLRTHRLALYVDEVSGRRFNGGAMVPPAPFVARA